MRADLPLCLGVLLAASSLGPQAPPSSASPPPFRPVESIRSVTGAPIVGRIEGDAAGGFRFRPDQDGDLRPLEQIERVEFSLPPAPGGPPEPAFHVRIGPGDRISGRFDRLDEESVTLDPGPGGRPLRMARSGVLSISQSPGEVLVLAEGFETFDTAEWQRTGDPAVAPPETAREGKLALRLPAGGSGIERTLDEPLPSGRLDLDVLDDGHLSAGHRWVVELAFRSPSGESVIQVVPGWDANVLAVRTRGTGPPLAVQPLERKSGWRRLSVQFEAMRTAIAIDGQELAYGDGPGGPLVRLRLATEPAASDAKGSPAAVLDDLRLVRFAEAPGPAIRDVDQDELRMPTGDQLFGTLLAADETTVRIRILERDASLSWRDVEGLYLRRAPTPANPVDGLWVRVRWASDSASGAPGDRVEGALVRVDDESFVVATPYAGEVAVPRGQTRELQVLGRLSRQVLDPTPHHLGSAVSASLDPPQPEGGTLELVFEHARTGFEPTDLAIDVVQAIGIEGDLLFSEAVRRGELVTHLALDGKRFDVLNRHITRLNDSVLRLRIPLPPGRLEPGRHTLRFEQAGTRDDPTKLDNLGILCIALERPQAPAAPGGGRR